MAEEMKARMDAIKKAAIEDPEFYTPERVFAMLNSIAGATMAAPWAAAGGAGSGEEKKVQLESTDSKLDRELDTERGLWAMSRQDPRVMTPSQRMGGPHHQEPLPGLGDGGRRRRQDRQGDF